MGGNGGQASNICVVKLSVLDVAAQPTFQRKKTQRWAEVGGLSGGSHTARGPDPNQ